MIFYLFLLALVPPLLVMAMLFFSDRFEKEPLPLIFACMAGGVLTTVPIMGLARLLPGFFSLQFASPLCTALLNSFVHAAFLEETLKFLVVYLIVLKARSLNEPFDAVVYYVAVGVGFAVIENLQYIAMGSQEALAYGDLSGVYTPFVQVSMIMGVMRSLPGHMVFAGLSGYFVSRYRFGRSAGKIRWLALAWGVALVVHGMFNFLLYVFPGNATVAAASWLFMAAGAAVFLCYPLLLASPFNKPRRALSLKARRALRQSQKYSRGNWRLFSVLSVLFMGVVIGTHYLNRLIMG